MPDISHNATANLGYADVRFLRPVYPGDTLVAESEVIGLREVSSGEAGVVYVRTRGTNQKGQEVLSFVRWVMVPKRDKAAAMGVDHTPTLPPVVTVDRLPVPEAMNLRASDSDPDSLEAHDLLQGLDDVPCGEQHHCRTKKFEVGVRLRPLLGLRVSSSCHDSRLSAGSRKTPGRVRGSTPTWVYDLSTFYSEGFVRTACAAHCIQ